MPIFATIEPANPTSSSAAEASSSRRATAMIVTNTRFSTGGCATGGPRADSDGLPSSMSNAGLINEFTITFVLRSSRSSPAVMLRGNQWVPHISKLRAAGAKQSDVRLPRDEACCTLRRNVALASGSHAFVLVPGERHLRLSMVAAHFGSACGHAQLAAEGRVLFAGEVLLDTDGVLLAWSNLSGTYKPPRRLARQVGLPLELLWVVVMPGDVLASAPASAGDAAGGVADGTPTELGPSHVPRRQLDALYGMSNHWTLNSGIVLVRDSALPPLATPRARHQASEQPWPSLREPRSDVTVASESDGDDSSSAGRVLRPRRGSALDAPTGASNASGGHARPSPSEPPLRAPSSAPMKSRFGNMGTSDGGPAMRSAAASAAAS